MILDMVGWLKKRLKVKHMGLRSQLVTICVTQNASWHCHSSGQPGLKDSLAFAMADTCDIAVTNTRSGVLVSIRWLQSNERMMRIMCVCVCV